MTVVFFAVTPRIRLGHLSRRMPSAQRTVGFSDTISMGDGALAASDRRVAARVGFTAGGEPIPPPVQYMKGATYSVFTGSQWRRSWEPASPVPRIGTGYHVGRLPPGAEPVVADVTLEPLDSAALFTWGAPVQVEGPLGDLRSDPDGNLLLQTADRPAIRYRVRFLARQHPPHAASPPPRGTDLRMPPGDWQELAALAAEVAPPGLPDPERAARLSAHLESGYRYTTEGPARDVREFLFVRKAGYCEHFATALCLLLRASGIPSRVAAGYLGGEWNDVGNYLIVRQSDAHAWTEAWIGNRWATLDATPTRARDALAAAGPRTTGGMRYLDWLRRRWDQYVIDYDLAAQARGVGAVGRMLRGLGTGAGVPAPTAVGGEAAGWTAALAGGALAVLLWRLLRGGAADGTREGAPLPAPYARLFRALERNGWRRAPGNAPADLLRAAAAARPALAADAERFLSLYHRDRFGASPLPPELRDEAARLAARLRASIPRAGAE